MIDLTDVTFNLPIRIDSEERKENINIILKYLTSKFETNIIVLEDGDNRNLFLDKYHKNNE